MKVKKGLLLILILFLFQQAFACRYTVREIGYTDLGESQYKLIMFVDRSTDTEIISGFEQLSYATLLDTNILAEVINVSDDDSHPAIKYLKEKKIINGQPVLLLVAPSGSGKIITMGSNFEKEALWDMMEGLINSPIQSKMSKDLIRSYGVVLVLKGTDEDENKRIRGVVDRAVLDIEKVMHAMAKPVDLPIQVYELSLTDRLKEEILMWSMGISLVDDTPRVVSIFGRGRMMGEPLKSREVSNENLFKQLSIIGADCECGLDRKWLLGAALPMRWSAENSNELAKTLGFDVENPVVKSEMSQIMSIDLKLISDISQSPYLNTLERSMEVSNQENKSNYEPGRVLWYSALGLVFVILILGVKFIRKH